MGKKVIGHPDLAAALDRPMGDLPKARYLGVTVTADGLLAKLRTGHAAAVRERMIAVSPYWLGAEWEPGEIVNLNSFGDWRVTREQWTKEARQWEYFGVPHIPNPFDDPPVTLENGRPVKGEE